MNKINTCNNCGKQGHISNNCKFPIISHGVILYCKDSNSSGYKYLMIRRRHSFGFIDFIRGKYSLSNKEHIILLINEMSMKEKQLILTSTYNELCYYMSDNSFNNIPFFETNIKLTNDNIIGKQKFDFLKASNTDINLKTLVQESTTNWSETEWEFPKGRRNYQEYEVDCAIREFREETGITNDIFMINNIQPFEEIFIGSNYKPYIHKFYLAYSPIEISSLDKYQKTEIGSVKWCTLEECLDKIRPYNLEKQTLIKNINNVLEEYSIY